MRSILFLLGLAACAPTMPEQEVPTEVSATIAFDDVHMAELERGVRAHNQPRMGAPLRTARIAIPGEEKRSYHLREITRTGGVTVWAGYGEDPYRTSLYLAYSGDLFSAIIVTPEGIGSVIPTRDGYRYVPEPNDEFPHPPRLTEPADKPMVEATPETLQVAGQHIVDVFVGYTRARRDFVAGMNMSNEAAHRVLAMDGAMKLAYTRGALQNSDSEVTVRLVGTGLWDFPEPGYCDLGAIMRTGNGAGGPEALATRDAFDADLYVMLAGTGQGSGCTVGNLTAATATPVRYAAAMGVSTPTFAHEVGHLIGGRHNRKYYTDRGLNAATDYSFGSYVGDGTEWAATIVSYGCDGKQPCTGRIQAYSNPDVTIETPAGSGFFDAIGEDYSNYPVGTYTQTAADNVRNIDLVGAVVAGFEPPPPSLLPRVATIDHHYYDILPDDELLVDISVLAPDPGWTELYLAVGESPGSDQFFAGTVTPGTQTVSVPLTSRTMFARLYTGYGDGEWYATTYTMRREGSVAACADLPAATTIAPTEFATSPCHTDDLSRLCRVDGSTITCDMSVGYHQPARVNPTLYAASDPDPSVDISIWGYARSGEPFCCAVEDVLASGVDELVVEGTNKDDLISFTHPSYELSCPGGTSWSALARGNDGADDIAGSNSVSTCYDETLRGGTGRDTIHGNDGPDAIFGDDGGDFLFGDDGDDSIKGGAHGDLIEGGDGFDTLWGGFGDDTVRGGPGQDAIQGGGGADTLEGNGAGDLICDESELDTIDGGGGRDFLYWVPGTQASPASATAGDGNDVCVDDTLWAASCEDDRVETHTVWDDCPAR